MSKRSLLYGIIGLLVGVVIAGLGAAYAVNNNHQGMMRSMGMHTTTNNNGVMDNEAMTMDEMTGVIKNKTGNAFDRTFIEQMIIHHQGAIDMAKLAQVSAEHDEVKDLAKNILSAQSKEIDMMQTWQSQWGYKSTPQSHNMMGM